MKQGQSISRAAGKRDWLKGLVALLLAEKIIQHITVTLAFYFNWDNIRTSLVVDPDVLMASGAFVAVLFAVAFWGFLQGRLWVTNLSIGLALFDIVGEFVAQGKIAILITVSFLVAIILLVAALSYRKQQAGGPVAG